MRIKCDIIDWFGSELCLHMAAMQLMPEDVRIIYDPKEKAVIVANDRFFVNVDAETAAGELVKDLKERFFIDASKRIRAFSQLAHEILSDLKQLFEAKTVDQIKQLAEGMTKDKNIAYRIVEIEYE